MADIKYKKPPLDPTRWFTKKTAGVTKFGTGCPETNPPAPPAGPDCTDCDRVAPNNCSNCTVCTPQTMSLMVVLPNLCGGCIKEVGADTWWKFSGYNGLSTSTCCLLQDVTDKCQWRGFIESGLKRQQFSDSNCTVASTNVICERLEVRADIIDESSVKKMRVRIFTTNSPTQMVLETKHTITGGDCSAISGTENNLLTLAQCGDDLGGGYQAAGYNGSTTFNSYCCGGCDDTAVPSAVTADISDVQGAAGMPDLGQDCEECDLSAFGLWGGVLTQLAGQCRYQANAPADSRLGDWVASRGDLLFNSSTEEWVLQLYCATPTSEKCMEWRKSTFPKDDPVGTYHYAGGQCTDGDCTSSIDVT